MLPNLTPDVALAERLFDTLRERSFDGVGVTRDAYGPGERMAHALLRGEAAALGLETAADPAGNLLMVLPGADRAAGRSPVARTSPRVRGRPSSRSSGRLG